MAALGVDYSFARPGGAAIKAAGFTFVCRYLASSPGKVLTAPERDDLRNNGLSVVLVFEDYANQALLGEVQGVKDAQEALAQANALGLPTTRPIYFAVDFDASEQDQAAIDAYLTAAGSVIGAGRVGIYGGYYVVKRCLDHGTAKWGWQTVAWSGGKVDPRVHIYQNGQSAFGGGADINEARQADFGQWGTMEEVMITKEDEMVLAELATGSDPGPDYSYPFVNTSNWDQCLQFWRGQSQLPNLRNQIAELRSELTAASTTVSIPVVVNPPKPSQLEPRPTPRTPSKSIWQKISAFWHDLAG